MSRIRSLAAVGAALALFASLVPGNAEAIVANPYADPFYVQQGGLDSLPNGALISARPVSLVAANQVTLKATAYQLKYRSQDSLGNPVADVTTVILPALRNFNGPAPVLSYQIAEDSLGLQCAPSYALRTGSSAVSASEAFLITLALAQGWVVSVPDYEGPLSEYTAGVQAGHAVLDGVLAVERFAASGASPSSRVGLWGYSGGGQATAWAGELQGSYAPALNVAGIAEGGVPADIGSVIESTDGTPLAGEEVGAAVGLSRAYPQASLAPLLNSAGIAAAIKVGQVCNSDMLATFANTSLDSLTTVPDALDLPQMSAALAADQLGQQAPVAPVYDYHAVNDELIPIAANDALQAQYCSEGVNDYYVRLPTGGHIPALLGGASGALAWLSDRFAGKPAVSNCPN